MDQYAAALANRLVGNTTHEAVLECTYLGPKFTVDVDTVIACTGAPVEVQVNGKPFPNNTRIELVAGDEVSFGFLPPVGSPGGRSVMVFWVVLALGFISGFGRV